MSEHTKGEWEIALPKHPDIRQIEDRLICVRVGDEKLHIAEVYQYQNHNNREANGTAIANARLIAAAPDLLAACETDADLANFAINAAKTGHSRNHLTEINIKRLAAIAKAKKP